MRIILECCDKCGNAQEIEINKNPEKALMEMLKIKDEFEGDPEVAHMEADALVTEILIDMGYGEMVRVFREMEKRYS